MSAFVSKQSRRGRSELNPKLADCTSSDSDDDEDMAQTEVQVEFEARAPEETDFHGIERLLRQVFLKEHLDLSALTQIVVSQGHIVGSVLKQCEVPEEDSSSDDDHVFGITTAVNITDRLKDSECIRQIRDVLLARARDNADDRTLNLLRRLFDCDSALQSGKHRVGLLLNERFVNIPPKVAAPLYESLRKEMQAAIQSGEKFAFDYYILLSKLFKAHAPRQTRRPHNVTMDVFSNAEDEIIFDTETVAWFEFSVADQSDTGLDGDWSDCGGGDDDNDDDQDQGMTPFRRVAIIPADRYEGIVSEMKDAFA